MEGRQADFMEIKVRQDIVVNFTDYNMLLGGLLQE